jgi:excinuclease ABC subunit C
MIELPIPDSEQEAERFLEELPNRPAVFLLWPREGNPYLARTNVLRRRVARLLRAREAPSRSLNLRGTVERIEYALTGSRLEGQVLLWEQARRHFPGSYREIVRIRLPYYVKLILSNAFPRMQVTARVGRAPAVYVGPFRNRSKAVEFEARCLDLFQLRRCEEDLAPNPDHPGCMYGEMGKCLRPCQMAVGVDEYRAEAARVADFLRTGGKSLLEPAANAREQLSAELDFEGAALMHERCRRIEEAVGTRDEMARDVERLHGIAVLPSAEPDALELGWLRAGRWGGFARLEFESRDGNPVSLDARLRELASAVRPETVPHAARVEQLAIVSRWFYSSWRDGEMLIFDDWARIPFRKLVNAISRVAAEQRRKPAGDASR